MQTTQAVHQTGRHETMWQPVLKVLTKFQKFFTPKNGQTFTFMNNHIPALSMEGVIIFISQILYIF